MFDRCLTVSELPSGTYKEAVGYGIASYAFKYVSPCEFYDCPMQARCKSAALACESFRRFVNTDTSRYDPRPPTEPSRAIFDKIYSGVDDDE